MKKHKHEIFLFSAASTASCFILKESIKEWKKALFPPLPSAQMAGFLPFQFIFFSLSNQFMYFIGDVKTETTYSIIICIYINAQDIGDSGVGVIASIKKKKNTYIITVIFSKSFIFYIISYLLFIILFFLRRKTQDAEGREGKEKDEVQKTNRKKVYGWKKSFNFFIFNKLLLLLLKIKITLRLLTCLISLNIFPSFLLRVIGYSTRVEVS